MLDESFAAAACLRSWDLADRLPSVAESAAFLRTFKIAKGTPEEDDPAYLIKQNESFLRAHRAGILPGKKLTKRKTTDVDLTDSPPPSKKAKGESKGSRAAVLTDSEGEGDSDTQMEQDDE
jgi:hypothetical protein